MTPYAVICPYHGKRFLTEKEYERQMSKPAVAAFGDDLWRCPDCGRRSGWDDDNYAG